MPFSPEDLTDPGIERTSPLFQGHSLPLQCVGSPDLSQAQSNLCSSRKCSSPVPLVASNSTEHHQGIAGITGQHLSTRASQASQGITSLPGHHRAAHLHQGVTGITGHHLSTRASQASQGSSSPPGHHRHHRASPLHQGITGQHISTRASQGSQGITSAPGRHRHHRASPLHTGMQLSTASLSCTSAHPVSLGRGKHPYMVKPRFSPC